MAQDTELESWPVPQSPRALGAGAKARKCQAGLPCLLQPAFTCSVCQNPILLSLSPQWGPQAGGTQLTIYGKHLQTGGNISAFVGSQSCPM